MQISASPRDILDAIMTGRRADERMKLAEKMAPRRVDASARYSMEAIAQLEAAEKLRPEYALMNVIDRNRSTEEDRRRGRKGSSAFDDLIAAKIASSVRPIYANESGPQLDLLSDDPFAPATAVNKMKPKINQKAIATLESAGFPIEQLLGMSASAAGQALPMAFFGMQVARAPSLAHAPHSRAPYSGATLPTSYGSSADPYAMLFDQISAAGEKTPEKLRETAAKLGRKVALERISRRGYY